MTGELVLVVVLDVRQDAIAAFRAYERAAAELMARHGGRIERAIELETAGDAAYREVHVVRFPDAAAFDRYRAEPELAALRPTREACIVATELWRGRDVAI